ncbi:hypothetical protein [Streptomyces hyaluromycini]|uniref:hypothetical protein n=1 Tax=Streptomyces hyaluromycini TaxID=1377993 RepID=UPI000B5C5C9E|nr:hypothetical protein [Streptomyces hyaluromycini]
MAQAAPTSGGMPRSGRTPDVFSAQVHARARVAIPIVTGLIYGYWAAANRRSGGPITGWNLLFGFLTALGFAVVLYAMLAYAPRLPRELHALVWTAFMGIAFGFLYSQSGDSILRSIGMSLAIAAVTFILMFYRFYTHEDAAGHRIR